MVMSLRSKWAAGRARGGRISKSIRNRRATQPPAHFQRNRLGRGRLAVFPRCSLDPSRSIFAPTAEWSHKEEAKMGRDGRFARALKNSQLTCGDNTTICETVHYLVSFPELQDEYAFLPLSFRFVRNQSSLCSTTGRRCYTGKHRSTGDFFQRRSTTLYARPGQRAESKRLAAGD